MRRIAALLMGLGCALMLLGVASIGASLYGYGAEVRMARRAVVEEDRRTIKGAIAAYTAETGKAPTTLEDLVDAGYLSCVASLAEPQVLPHRENAAAERGCGTRQLS